MALRDYADRTVHRPAKANANSLDRMFLNQTDGRRLNLLQNAGGSPALINIVPPECRQIAAAFIADAKLEFRAANFNAEVHNSLRPEKNHERHESNEYVEGGTAAAA